MAEDIQEKQKQKAKKASAAKTIDTWKHKKWYTVIAPQAFNSMELGETPANEPTEVEGRSIIANLMVLTGNAKRQNTNLVFQVRKVQGDKAHTELISYHVVPSSIKRMMRRNKSRIDDSFVCKTSDGRLVRMKPFLLTASLARRAATTTIRRVAKQHVVREVAKVSFDALAQDLVSGKFQKSLRESLNHIFPVVGSEIRVMEVVTEGYKGRVEEPTPEPKARRKADEGQQDQMGEAKQEPDAQIAATEAGESDAEEAAHEAEEAIEEETEEEQAEAQ